MALHASRFGLAEQKRNTWFVVIPAGVDYEDALDPSFWAHVSAKLRPCDLIEIVNDEMTYRAVLMVRQSGHLFAVVNEVSKIEFVGKESASPAGELSVAWGGPHDKHRIIRTINGKKDVLAKGFDTPEAAAKEMALLMARQAPAKAA